MLRLLSVGLSGSCGQVCRLDSGCSHCTLNKVGFFLPLGLICTHCIAAGTVKRGPFAADVRVGLCRPCGFYAGHLPAGSADVSFEEVCLHFIVSIFEDNL